MLKIRRPLGRLIFNMGIAIPGKTVFLIETAPWALFWGICKCINGLFWIVYFVLGCIIERIWKCPSYQVWYPKFWGQAILQCAYHSSFLPFAGTIVSKQLSYLISLQVYHYSFLGLYSLNDWASYHKISRSLEASRFGFKLFRSLWKSHRQHRYKDACQFSDRCDHYITQSRGLETSQDLGAGRQTA